MAIIRKDQSEVSKTKVEKVSKVVLNLSLSTENSKPPRSMGSYSMLIYGAKKIGKTSLAAKFPNPYFLCTEPGTKALRVKSSHCPDWDHFTGYVDLLCTENDPNRTVVVDIIDIAYEFIYDKVCSALKIDSPTEENDFGATWRKIRSTFGHDVKRLCSLAGGTIFLSHDTEREIELRDGNKIDRIQPTMSKQAMQEVEGIVDTIGLYGYEGDKRFMWLDGRQDMVAGSRLEENFLIAGGKPGVPGHRITRVPMGGSSQEAYENLTAAFNNEQTTQDGSQPKAAPAPAAKTTVSRFKLTKT